MKIKVLFLPILLLAFCIPLVNAQDETEINVTYTFSYGGLLWVNGTTIINGSTITYQNNTLLILSATPTNANYSYASMNINETITTDNPVLYNLTATETGNWNQTINANFIAETIPTPTPTPDPNAVTAEDSLGVAVAFAVCVMAVCIGVVYAKNKN